MSRRGSGAKSLYAAMLTVFLWGGITAGPSVAGTSTITDMGYTLIDLGTLGGSWSRTIAINDKGQVIGWFIFYGDPIAEHAFLYSKWTMTDLGNLGHPFYINDKGQWIGYSSWVPPYPAFLYSDGIKTNLTQVVFDLFLVDKFQGNGINKAGQIIGTGYRDGNEHAFILTVPKI
jgi:probable HAF family extracellular repeat protein